MTRRIAPVLLLLALAVMLGLGPICGLHESHADSVKPCSHCVLVAQGSPVAPVTAVAPAPVRTIAFAESPAAAPAAAPRLRAHSRAPPATA